MLTIKVERASKIAMSSSCDDVAHQLLGWSNGGENAAPLQSRAAQNTNDNLDSFRRAVDILSSTKGHLSFVTVTGDAENGSANPLLVVKGYCRLIKCSLAAATAVDLSKDAGELLKNLGTKLNAALQEQLELYNQPDKSAKQDDYSLPRKKKTIRNKVVLFYFKFIFDVVNSQITKHIRLLGPTYRSVCDVAASFIALLQAEKKKMDLFVKTFLPSIGWEGLSVVHNDAKKVMKIWKEANEFFGRAMLYLLSLLDTHLKKMHQALSKQQSKSADTSMETRVATFLLARIISLLSVLKELDQATKSKDFEATEDDTSHNNDVHTMMEKVLPRFIKISCLSLVAKENLNRIQTADNQRSLLEAIVGLGAKAGNSLGKIFCRDLELSNGHALNLGLDRLVESKPDSCDDQTILSGFSVSLKDLFPLGRLSLANMVLGKLFATTQVVRLNIDSISTFYESLLFNDVPKCYHLVASVATSCGQASEELRSFIDVLENAGHAISGKNDMNSMTNQHHILVRWLHLSQCHPLSNELLLRAIHGMILSSCSAKDKNWNHDASNLIRLMSELMFHRETDSLHRRNISILLARLLSPKTHTEARSLTLEVLWREFMKSNLLSHSIRISHYENNRRQKRKRNQNKRDELHSVETESICCILESLFSAAACTPQMQIDNLVREKMQCLWRDVANCQAKSSDTIQDENDCRILFLFSCSTGLLRGTSNVANFLRIVGLNECSSIAFMEKTLSYIEAQVGRMNGSEIYSCLVFKLCSSLLGAALACTDIDLSESFLRRLGLIISSISNFAVKTTSIDAISLQRSVVQFVCKVGIQINSGCSTQAVESLVGSISCILKKSSWYHISPDLSSLESFIKQHPSHLTLLLPASTPTSVKSLLASRVQGKLYSITNDKSIDASSTPSCATFKESCFLQEYCISKRQDILAASRFGSECCPRCGYCFSEESAV